MEHHKQQNFLYRAVRRNLQDFQEARCEFFTWDGLRPGSIADASDEAQFA